MGSRKGRPRAFSDETLRLIENWATVEYPDMDRDALAVKLVEKLENDGIKAGSHSTLIAYISTARNKPAEPIDKVWGLNTLRDYPLPSETIPFIVKINQLNSEKGYKFTIRQAQWVSNLCHVVEKLDDLNDISFSYALYEKICKAANVPFDTSEPDKVLPDVVKVKLVFEKLLGGSPFRSRKFAFQQVAGMELQGIVVLTNTLFLKRNEIYPVVSGEMVGLPTDRLVLLKPLGTAEKILSQLKTVKQTKKTPTGEEGYIILKGRPLAVEVPEEELNWLQRQYSEGIELKEGATNGKW